MDLKTRTRQVFGRILDWVGFQIGTGQEKNCWGGGGGGKRKKKKKK